MHTKELRRIFGAIKLYTLLYNTQYALIWMGANSRCLVIETAENNFKKL